MDTHMPEDKEKRKIDLETFLESEKFNRLRGTLPNLTSFIDEILFEEKSPYFGHNPSQIKKKWEKLLADLNPMIIKLAQLRRQEDKDLINQVLRALATPDYVLPGELTATTKWYPITVFMIEPAKTLVMLKWFQLVESVHYLFEAIKKRLQKTSSDELKLSLELLKTFDSLEKFVLLNQKDYEEGGGRIVKGHYYAEGFPLRLALYQDVAMPYHSSLWNLLDKEEAEPPIIRSLRLKGKDFFDHSLRLYKERRCLYDQDFGHFEIMYDIAIKEKISKTAAFFSESFLFIAYGLKQSRILHYFPREQQQFIATWQFRLPRKLIDPKNLYFAVGLHQAEEHEYWKKRWPLFASRGVTKNFGAIIFPLIGPQSRRYIYDEPAQGYKEKQDAWKRNSSLPQYDVFVT
jgi:hypothetical protein